MLHHPLDQPRKRQRLRLTLAAWLAAWLLAWAPTWVTAQTAQTTPPPQAPAGAAPQPAADTDSPSVDQTLESTRRNTRSASEWLARHVDGWFGEQALEPGSRVSDGRLSLALYKRSDQRGSIDLRFNAQFRLPNAEKFAYLFIGRDDPRDVVRDTPDALSRRQQLLPSRPTERSVLAGLGLTLPQDVALRLGVGARLKPYVQARYNRPWALGPDQTLTLRETLFWTEADRVGSTTALTYDLGLSPTLALRWLNAATITQMTQNFEWSSSLGLHRGFGQQRLLSLELLVSGTGTQGPGVGMSDYGVLARWEQPVYKTWLLAEVVAGHFWPRPDADSPRGHAWALGGSLKMQF